MRDTARARQVHVHVAGPQSDTLERIQYEHKLSQADTVRALIEYLDDNADEMVPELQRRAANGRLVPKAETVTA